MINTNKIREIAGKLDEMNKREQDIRFSQKYYQIRTLGIINNHGDKISLHLEDYPELSKVADLLLDYARVASVEKQKELKQQLTMEVCNVV